MPPEDNQQLRHLLIKDTAKTEKYTSPRRADKAYLVHPETHLPMRPGSSSKSMKPTQLLRLVMRGGERLASSIRKACT